MSKTNYLVSATSAPLDDVVSWLAERSIAGVPEPNFTDLYRIEKSLTASAEIPERDDNDAEMMKDTYGFSWRVRIFMFGRSTLPDTFKSVCELAFEFAKDFDGDFWLLGDHDGPYLCRLSGKMAAREELFRDRDCPELLKNTNSVWQEDFFIRFTSS